MKTRVVLSIGVIAAVFVCIFFFIPQFLQPINLITNILVPAGILSIFALGMMLVMAGGGVDLSMGAIAGLSGLIGVGLNIFLPSWLAFILAILSGIAFGLGNGTLIAFFGISPFVVTLGSTFIYKGLQYVVASAASSGGIQGTYLMLSRSMMKWGSDTSILTISLIISFVLFVFFELSVVGRKIKFTGTNPDAARLSGIKTRYYTALTYVIAGMLAAVAGVLLAALQGLVRVGLGEDQLLDIFIAPLLGTILFGRFKVSGTLISVFIIIALGNLTTILGVSITMNPIIKGAMLVGILFAVGIRSWGAKRRLNLRGSAPPLPSEGA